MSLLSWAPRWPLAAASRREITEAALTSLSARATVMPSPNPPPSPDPFASAWLPSCPPTTTNPPSVQNSPRSTASPFAIPQPSLSASSWFVLLPATSKKNQGSRSHRHGI
ncbi:unnamed protein product [Pleuronectes platessa]|uniref:Uncharacterized protein n=1 Tax=Pleuronectes platessa TaxID=8262 RepID=A0A9N7W0T7_PLEPL|nr:unnamed protein product [Pleuronectes platessa]